MRETPLPIGLERRKEDYQLITGRARFVDDVRLPQERPTMLHMILVRSPYAHAKITSIRFDAARDVPGVVALMTGADLVNNLHPLDIAIPLPGLKKPDRLPLALGKVRYVGDPVAIILAESPAIAEDARDLVEVDYEPLQPVVDPEVAMESGTALLYEDFGSNSAFSTHSGQGDVQSIFAQADRTITLRLVNQRVAPSSLEPRACLFDYDPKVGKLTGWVSSQGVYRMREALSSMLGIDRSHIRVINAEVGGGFGSKNGFVGEEYVAAWLAVKYGRPVKWIETRSENLQAQTQGRGQINYVEAAFQHSGGGTGFSFGRLRPAGDVIASTGGTSSGPLSFLKIFDYATENIKLGGKRRGANMGVLPVDHPDILAFIDAKRTAGSLANFNLSVGITDIFMDAVEHNECYELHHPTTGKAMERLNARNVFDQLAQAAWLTGDPGLIFLDTVNRAHPIRTLGRIEATNPCGEVPLLPYESCNLGSINLARFVKEKGDAVAVDWPRLAEVVQQAIRFLDDVLVVNRYPLPQIEAVTLANRKIGLGVMGTARTPDSPGYALSK